MNRPKRRLLRSSRRGFIEGLARILDLGNTLNRRSRLRVARRDVDANALRSDWVAVGQDIQQAIGIYGMTAKGRSLAKRRND